MSSPLVRKLLISTSLLLIITLIVGALAVTQAWEIHEDTARAAFSATTDRYLLFSLFGLIAIAIPLACFILFQLVTNIAKPIRQMLRQTELITLGKHITLTPSNTPSEIVDLHKHINKMARDIKKRELEMKAQNKELSSFIYKASHDMRTPLVSIMGVTNMAIQQIHDKQAIGFFKLISTCIKGLDDKLLDLTHIVNMEKDTVRKQVIDLNHEIDVILASIQNLENSDKIEFEKRMDHQSQFQSDRSLVTSILQNLITNSIKYYDPSKDNPRVSIQVQETKSVFVFEVQDNGLGIAKEHQPKVFDMFYRASDDNNGNGLGLFIVKNAVDKLGGRILLKSKLKIGTIVTISLPRITPIVPLKIEDKSSPLNVRILAS